MSSTALSQFGALGVSATLVGVLNKLGLTEPTPIQVQAIPPALEGRDVLGCAQTGTGKTAAFVIPIIERLVDGPKGHPRAMILAPTRELAFQIQETVDKFGRVRGIFATTLVGGADMHAQVRGLRQRPDIIVATPGRLLDHMWQGTVSFTKLRMVVLDEADRMLDMGFAPQLNQIIEALPETRQTLLFSATMPNNLADLARMSLNDPFKALVAKSATPAEGVTHTVHHTANSDKTSLLLSILKETEGSVLVFTRTKHRADRIGETLEKVGCRVAVLHAGRRLPQRRAALEGFRRGRFEILVATDIAARGLDVDNIQHVINYDLPHVPEDYIHRIGRTARKNTKGWATSFVTGEDNRSLRMIEKLLGKAVPCAPGSRPPMPAIAPERRGPRPNSAGRGFGTPRSGSPGRHDRPAVRRPRPSTLAS
ncbi:DEAD/DEAH box helicase [Candidatus Nitrospira neomarina]|uniref:DEAD/DEAH box helicase n=1 Tax=Candidatus Nitrospira neomarina TaxID=3020899 RepID=A0AA96GJC5_9BACT|nr:DEAD/DEAH box helicase [Candidatus Nitrospira neomarina]WNM63504.1 DEAD/DEAH box helicase [Candidatus Nitrospira neomarina]